MIYLHQVKENQREKNLIYDFFIFFFFFLVTIPETVRMESDRPRRRQACLCRTAFVMWLLPFLSEGQNRDRTL